LNIAVFYSIAIRQAVLQWFYHV